MRENKYPGQEKWDKGSVSIEASLSLTFFVFFMVGVIGLINVCRVQAKISSALHMAAIDISHMSYLLQITGVHEWLVDIDRIGEEAGASLTEHGRSVDRVLAGTETLLSTISGGIDTIESAELTPTGFQETVTELNTAITNGEQQVEYLAANADALAEDLRGIAENPVEFVGTVAQNAIAAGVNGGKNILAGIFAKALIQDHIGAGGVITDVNSYLEQMGVVDGLNGMKFSASSIFVGDDGADINLVVLYEVKIFPFFGDTFKIKFAQSASTRAWLSGDVRTVTELPAVNE